MPAFIYDLLVKSWNLHGTSAYIQEKYLSLRIHFDASSLKSTFDISGVVMIGGSPAFACGVCGGGERERRKIVRKGRRQKSGEKSGIG
jgi:hypothetical protein